MTPRWLNFGGGLDELAPKRSAARSVLLRLTPQSRPRKATGFGSGGARLPALLPGHGSQKPAESHRLGPRRSPAPPHTSPSGFATAPATAPGGFAAAPGGAPAAGGGVSLPAVFAVTNPSAGRPGAEEPRARASGAAVAIPLREKPRGGALAVPPEAPAPVTGESPPPSHAGAQHPLPAGRGAAAPPGPAVSLLGGCRRGRGVVCVCVFGG